MTYSITYYLRRKKYIYCTLNINGLESSRSTGITVYDPNKWTGRYIIDDRQKKRAQDINNRLHDYKSKLEDIISEHEFSGCLTPSKVFDYFDGHVPQPVELYPVTLTQAAEYYVTMNNKLKKYSQHTLRTYKRITEYVIPGYLEYLGVQNLNLSQFKTSQAKGFKAYMMQKDFGPSAQHLYMTFMKSVFKIILEDFPASDFPQVNVLSNPFLSRALKTSSKDSSKIMDYIPPSIEKDLWLVYESDWKPEYNDYMLLGLLMWNTGLSFIDTNSPCAISKDFSSGEDIFQYTRNKTGTTARVLCYQDLNKVLSCIEENKERYQEKYNNWLPIKRFIKTDGEIDLKAYEHQYNRFYQFLHNNLSKKLEHTIGAHTFRHSFAVKMISLGHSLDAVKVMMGHTSIVTTESHYAYFEDSRLIDEKKTIYKSKLTGS